MEQKSFEELGIGTALATALSKQGINIPTSIQESAIPQILNGISVIGQAPTGTGKTLAYLLPLLQTLDAGIPQVQAIILAPTYELAMQIYRVADNLIKAAGLSLKVQSLIGGANIARQIDALKKKPQLVVGSTGRIIELAGKGKLKLQRTRLMVLDEFDRLLDDQNLQLTRELINSLPDADNIQYLMFSATAPKKALSRAEFLNEPKLIQVKEATGIPDTCENLYYIIPFRQKIDFLKRITRSLPIERGLVFVNKSFSAERAVEKLSYEGIKTGSLIGNADKSHRKQVLADFENGKLQLLLSTDLAARGLDIGGVDYVINVDFPESSQIYLHRAGRTARAGAEGKVITLSDPKEAYHIEEIEKSLGIRFKKLKR